MIVNIFDIDLSKKEILDAITEGVRKAFSDKKADLRDSEKTPIDSLAVPVRVSTALKSMNYHYVEDVLDLTDGEIFKIPNIGRLSLEQLKRALLASVHDKKVNDL